jgi:hypothetical protein
MFRNDRSYDYGLRGAPRPRRRRPASFHPERPDVSYGGDYERRADPARRAANRVTARYTYDYVYGGRGERYPRNFNAYTGDYSGRMREPTDFPRPYMTDGGTRTWRGYVQPYGYDTPDYGPDFGGRYRDEL